MGRSASEAAHGALDELGVASETLDAGWQGERPSLQMRPLTLVERIRVAAASVPALVGNFEAAQILGVPTSNLSGPRPVRGLPEPVAHLRSGRVWRRADIEALAEQRAQEKAARVGS